MIIYIGQEHCEQQTYIRRIVLLRSGISQLFRRGLDFPGMAINGWWWLQESSGKNAKAWKEEQFQELREWYF